MGNGIEAAVSGQLDQIGTVIQPPPPPLGELLHAGRRARRRRHARTGLLTCAAVAFTGVAVAVSVNQQPSSTSNPSQKNTPRPTPSTSPLRVQAQAPLASVVTPPLGRLAYASTGQAIYLSVTRAGQGEGGYQLVKLSYPSLRQLDSTPVGGGTVVPGTNAGVWTVSAPNTTATGPGAVGTLTRHDPDTLAATRQIRLAFGPAHTLISGSLFIYTGGDNLAALDLPSATTRWSANLGTGSSNIVAIGASRDETTLYDVLDTRAGARLESRSLTTGQVIASQPGLVDGTLTPTDGGVWFSTWKAQGASRIQFYRGPRLAPGTRISAPHVGTNILPVPSGDSIWLVPTVEPGPLVCADPATGKVLSTANKSNLWPTDALAEVNHFIGVARDGVAILSTGGAC